ncbi:MAG: tyrosine-protein phosphatase [Clostridia bacterium]|nr:tyrosine-protein phosphatase [Clostridia bacterium]
MINLKSPKNGAVLDTFTDFQAHYCWLVKNEGTETANAWLDTAKLDIERSHPNVFTFEWESDTVAPYTFELSENADFAECTKAVTDEPKYDVTNLKNGVTYYWRVNGCEPFAFETVPHIARFIHIDDVKNVRDIGGVNIKQGLVFRGSEMNCRYKITDEGKATFLDELKIKTDLDLRGECLGKFTESPAGSDVNYVQLPYRAYSESFEEEHRRGICKIMDFLADESNYPIFIHCVGGADRTGAIALYLRALAGESDEVINSDYELTSLSVYCYALVSNGDAGYRSRNAPYYQRFHSLLDPYAPGEPMSVKIPRFLADCGVSEDCMKKIVSIIKK